MRIASRSGILAALAALGVFITGAAASGDEAATKGKATAPGKEPAPAEAPAILTAGIKGVRLEFQPASLAEGKTGKADEMAAILEAAATLKLEKSIRYRKTLLPPGEYAVTIESTSGKSFYFVIGARAEEDDADDRSGEPGEGPAARDGGAKAPEKNGTGAGTPAQNPTQGARPSGGSEGKRPETAPENGGAKGGDRAAPEKIRARFQIAVNPNPSKDVRFDIRPIQGGSRFELSLKAGASIGKANLSFAEEQEVKAGQ